MKNIWLKFKLWYAGYVDTDNRLHNPENPSLTVKFYPPAKLKNVINVITKFWLTYWQWIITTFIAFGILLIMILDYISLNNKNKTANAPPP